MKKLSKNELKNIRESITEYRVLVVGEYWYFIDSWWVRRFLLNDDNSSFDNRKLLESNLLDLKPNIKEKVDYYLFNKETYRLLHDTYGGGPEIKREVFMYKTSKTLNINPVFIKASLKDSSSSVLIDFCKLGGVSNIINRIIKHLKLDPDCIIRIWNSNNNAITFTDFKSFENSVGKSKSIEIEILLEPTTDRSIIYCKDYKISSDTYEVFFFFLINYFLQITKG
jgi:hypothetical protein